MTRGIFGASGALFGLPATGRGQTEGQASSQAQITTKAVIPEVGTPFAGNYVGQFFLVSDPTPRSDVSPDVIADCEFADWSPDETRMVESLLVDRLTDDPVSVVVQTFFEGDRPRIRPGTEFIINRVHDCPGDYLGLELEQVPVETFNPEYGTMNHPLVGESPGPTLSPTEGPEVVDSPGQPGFGVTAASLGVGVAALLRRYLHR